MNLEAIVSSFALVAASEMGDKTQLLAFSLASRFRRPWMVMGGILVATLANHALASSAGVWISAHVPQRVMAGVLAATFVAFGLWTLRPDTLEQSDKPSRFGPFLTTAFLFFLAEMGDKTQLATVALAAREVDGARDSMSGRSDLHSRFDRLIRPPPRKPFAKPPVRPDSAFPGQP